MLSRAWLCNEWTVAHQGLLSTEFSRQEFWNGLSFPSPGDFPNPRIKPMPLALAGGFFSTEPPEKPPEKKNAFNFYISSSIFWSILFWLSKSIFLKWYPLNINIFSSWVETEDSSKYINLFKAKELSLNHWKTRFSYPFKIW